MRLNARKSVPALCHYASWAGAPRSIYLSIDLSIYLSIIYLYRDGALLFEAVVEPNC